jgi:hypothetical protein
MKFHVRPGAIIPRNAIPEEQSDWPTALPGASWTAERGHGGGVTFFAGEDEGVLAFNLTFDGAWAQGAAYVVHAISMPLLPPNSGLVLDDDGPCPRYVPEDDEGPPHTTIMDCNRLLTATGVDVAGATVFCPTNSAVKDLVEFLGFKTAARLFAELAVPGSAVTAVVKKVMQFHVHPGGLLTPADIPEGDSTITTMLSESLKAVKRVEDDGSFRIVLFANDDAGIKYYNLTWDGDYKTGDAFIVHAING